MKVVELELELRKKPEASRIKDYPIGPAEYVSLGGFGICNLKKVGDVRAGELLRLTFEENAVLVYVFSIESWNEREKSADCAVYLVGRNEDSSDLMKEKLAMLQRLALPDRELSLSDLPLFDDRVSTLEYLRKQLFFVTEESLGKVADRILSAQQRGETGFRLLGFVEDLITMWRLDATRILLQIPSRGFPSDGYAFAMQGDFYDLCQKIPSATHYF